MQDIEHYDIPVYNFPYDVEEDDEETIQDNSELRVGVKTRDREREREELMIGLVGHDAVCGCWF